METSTRSFLFLARQIIYPAARRISLPTALVRARYLSRNRLIKAIPAIHFDGCCGCASDSRRSSGRRMSRLINSALLGMKEKNHDLESDKRSVNLTVQAEDCCRPSASSVSWLRRRFDVAWISGRDFVG